MTLDEAVSRLILFDLDFPACPDDARRAMAERDAGAFVCLVNHGADLWSHVTLNAAVLKAFGMYEAAIVEAFNGCKFNNRHHATRRMLAELAACDPDRLRSAGDPMPGAGPYTIFRGVAGVGSARRVRGLSWSLSRDVAAWFARRMYLPDPAVYVATVTAAEVMFHVAERGEQEVVTRPARCKRLPITLAEIEEGQRRVCEAR